MLQQLTEHSLWQANLQRRVRQMLKENVCFRVVVGQNCRKQ